MTAGSHDVLVAGAGAAGLLAALSAARTGARVVVLEGSNGSDSNLALSGGLVAAAGTRWQSRADIPDSADIWLEDMKRATDGLLTLRVARLVAARAAETLDLICDVTGRPVDVIGEMAFPGHAVPRLHEVDGLDGQGLARLLLDAASDHPRIRVVHDCRVEALTSSDGRVDGVRTARGEFRSSAIVLATGGYGASAGMLARHIPDMATASYIGSPHSDGHGIAMACRFGAATLDMGGYQGHGHATIKGGGRLGAGVTSVGAIMVNRAGRRFANEDAGPSTLAGLVAAQYGRWALELFTGQMHERYLRFASYRAAVEDGSVMSFADAGAAADAFGVDRDQLLATIAAYNQAVSGQEADDFGRTGFAGAIEGPIWAVAVTAALVHTQGGLSIDETAAVLDVDGRPIAGLFAAGGCAVGMTGNSPCGYLPGNGLAQSFTLGMVAGQSAASMAR